MITIEEKRTAARGAGLRQNEQNDFEENSDHSVNFVQKLEWRRHSHKENRDHYECEHQFADHSAEISQQTSPACPTGVDQSLAGNEFYRDRVIHRCSKPA